MPLWTAADLAAATEAEAAFAADGVSIDTRTIAPGDLFVALAGERGDGHDHVAEALARGAAGALVHRDVAGVPPGRLLRVADTLVGLRALAAHARARFRGRLVAVTGSVGKTTTKEMLRAALAAQAPTHAAVASYNNHWGVPLTLARLPADAAACVVEIGTNHRGEIAPLAALARPHVALITAIERTHLGPLGGIDAIAREKASIMSALPADGIAVLPAGSRFMPMLIREAEGRRIETFGTSVAADARLLRADSDAEGCDLVVLLHGRSLRLRLAAPGWHMANNAAAALTCVAALGFDPVRGAAALDGFVPVAGRGARRRISVGEGEAVLLDESYNASAAAVRAALAVLALQPARRRLAVLGDMLELGDEGPREHAGLAADVAACADKLYACGALTRHLYDALPAVMQGAFAEDAAALAPLVARAVAAGDAVLVKGSLGSRMALVVRALESAA